MRSLKTNYLWPPRSQIARVSWKISPKPQTMRNVIDGRSCDDRLRQNRLSSEIVVMLLLLLRIVFIYLFFFFLISLQHEPSEIVRNKFSSTAAAECRESLNIIKFDKNVEWNINPIRKRNESKDYSRCRLRERTRRRVCVVIKKKYRKKRKKKNHKYKHLRRRGPKRGNDRKNAQLTITFLRIVRKRCRIDCASARRNV